MRELDLKKDYARDSKGKKVKLIQEWLCIHRHYIAIDSDFGPATEYAVRKFQEEKGLEPDGVVGEKTFKQLTMPMRNALNSIAVDNRSPGDMVVAYAMQHLAQHPIEIGGQNRGPWVRLYMKGNEGRAWPWCAGFASFILNQACKSLKIPLPFRTSFSCDILAAHAREKGIFLSEKRAADRTRITPGSFFLNRRTSTDWVHTGIVIRAEEEFFHSIEGNTNDEGSREGYEVCRRVRGYKKKDFILI